LQLCIQGFRNDSHVSPANEEKAVLNSSENLNNYINGKLNQIFHIENLKCSQAKNDLTIIK